MKLFFIFISTLFLLLSSMNGVVYGANTTSPSDNHTAREEAEGKEIWEKLQAKQLECKNLTDDNFESLGEYFMGRMVGSSHEVMNNMMVRMMGEEGEKQMHIAVGKRNSGCDTNAPFPSGYGLPMMWWMMGSASPSATSSGPSGSPQGGGGGNQMMGYGGWGNMMGWGFGILGWLFMIIFWVLVILGVVALIRYLARSGQSREDKTLLDILKERYAKGEINKKEFEEKKKDLA